MDDYFYPVALSSQRPTLCCGCGDECPSGEMTTAGQAFTVASANVDADIGDAYLRTAGEPVCPRCKISSKGVRFNYIQYLEIRNMVQTV